MACFSALPEANQNTVVDYWGPVWLVDWLGSTATAGGFPACCRGLLAACLDGACLALGLLLPCAWRYLWRAGETTFSRSCVVPANQIEYAVSEAQEKPSVSFI